jgi:hypothetical protein
VGGPAIGTYIEAPRRHGAQLPVSLAPRLALLAGREELLSDLNARLWAGDGPGPRIVVLCGLGGAGKTSVAVEYAHRHLAEVGVAWQFAAGDFTVLAAGFGELAAQLGERGLADTRDPVVSVHAALAGSAAPWLVIFDNAADMASVAAFLPPGGPGRVLVTSQNAAWPGQVLDVPMLDRDAAAGFLVNRSGDPDRQAALVMAGELGGLPLALEQAAAYTQATGGTLAGYLDSFRRRRADVLARGEPTGYSKTVASTWALAFGRLQQAAPGAAGLLRLLAFCAPEAVPWRLLLQPCRSLAGRLGEQVAPVLVPLLEDELAAGDAVAALRRFSLVTLAGDGSVSVHRLVQAVTVDQMAAELAGEWRQAAAALIEAAIPDDAQLSEAWPTCTALLPHAQGALDLTSDGMWQIARYLGHSGSYPAARDLVQLIADAHRQDDAYGAEHPRTLTARHNFAHWTGMAGNPAAARDLFAALLPVRERVSGPEHPATLDDQQELARWTGEAGNPAAARDQLAQLLPVRQRVSGPEHPETLAAQHELAQWTGEAGDAAAARDRLATLLPVRERVSGPEHPATLAVRSNLARWTGRTGIPAAARDQLAQLLPVRERVSGLEHPETLATRHELARWTGAAGDAAAARDLCAELLPLRERILGAEHVDTLATRGNLARWTGEAGDPAAARDLFAGLLPVRERVLGPEHPHTLWTRGNLARWTGEAGDAAAARDLCAGLLPVFVRVLGPEHPATLTDRHALARWTGEAGDAAAAQDQYAELLPVTERVLGTEHPHTLADRDHLAYWTKKARDQSAT